MTTRRDFVRAASAAGALSLAPGVFAADRKIETTRIVIGEGGAICTSPSYVAEHLLKAEGFKEVEFLPAANRAKGDFAFAYGPTWLEWIDGGAPLVIVAGLHPGCIEIFGAKDIRSLRDLRGKVVAESGRGTGPRTLVSTMLSYVGLDPRKDIEWRKEPSLDQAARLLEEGKIQAFVGVPPEPQHLRARNVGNVSLNTTTDRPWSQHMCCMIAANRDFVRKNPVATKRALRAFLKASDLCASEPERASSLVAGLRPEMNPKLLQQVYRELPYRAWRELSSEGTVQFFALRLSETGMVKSNAQKLVSQATDWRFLNELKKELKV